MRDGEVEKREIHNVVADLMLRVLWNPDTTHGEADTAEHHIRVWKENNIVFAEVKKVR